MKSFRLKASLIPAVMSTMSWLPVRCHFQTSLAFGKFSRIYSELRVTFNVQRSSFQWCHRCVGLPRSRGVHTNQPSLWTLQVPHDFIDYSSKLGHGDFVSFWYIGREVDALTHSFSSRISRIRYVYRVYMDIDHLANKPPIKTRTPSCRLHMFWPSVHQGIITRMGVILPNVCRERYIFWPCSRSIERGVPVSQLERSQFLFYFSIRGSVREQSPHAIWKILCGGKLIFHDEPPRLLGGLVGWSYHQWETDIDGVEDAISGINRRHVRIEAAVGHQLLEVRCDGTGIRLENRRMSLGINGKFLGWINCPSWAKQWLMYRFLQ